MSEPNMDSIDEKNSGTIQFSLNKTKHVNLKKPARRIGKPLEEEEIDELQQEKEMLQNQATPTEFEDVFSDEEKQEEVSSAGVVSVEEVFKQKAAMINEDFHNETGEESEAAPNSKLKKAAIIIGVISGAIVLAAIAVGVIIIL